jgi:ABC-type sugar transport system substrate-binding protein
MTVIEEKTDSAVVGRVKAVSAAEALPAVQSMLQKDPDMNVVLCVADDGCTGASQAYKAAGVDPEGIYIAGWDGALGALKSVKEGGYVKADAALDLKEIGRSVVYVIDNIKNGVEPKDKLHPYAIVDAASGQVLDDLIASFG